MRSTFTPSELDRLAVCPKFQTDPTTDPDARTQGTSLHDAMERDLDVEDMDDQQAREAVVLARALTAPLVTGGEVEREKSVYIPELKRKGRMDLFCQFPQDRRAVVVEYKFGRRPVPSASKNWQLLACVLGVLHEYPDLDTVTGFVIAPLTQEADEALDTLTVTRETYPEYSKRLKDFLEQVSNPWAPPVTNDWCPRCRWFKRECPATTEALQTADVPKEAVSLVRTPLAQLSPDDRGKLLRALYLASKLYETLRKEAVAYPVTGFSVQTRKRPPYVSDHRALIERLEPELLRTDLLPALRLDFADLVQVMANRWGRTPDEVANELPLMYPDAIVPASESRFLRFTGAGARKVKSSDPVPEIPATEKETRS